MRCGNYDVAEPSGLAALAIDPADFWGLHAVAHIMEMQGRRREGIGLIEKHEPYFAGGANLIHHIWWHRAMFHMEQREFDIVLELYDRRFRNLASPLVQAQLISISMCRMRPRCCFASTKGRCRRSLDRDRR